MALRTVTFPGTPIKKSVGRRKELELNLEHITQEMYKKNLELAERNKTLLLLRHIDEVVQASAKEESKTIQGVAETLVTDTDFAFSLIFVADQDAKQMVAEGVAHQKQAEQQMEDFLKQQLGITSAQEGLPPQLASKMLSNRLEIIDSFSLFNDSISVDDSDSLKEYLSIQSLFVCPLQAGQGLIGILVLGVPLPKDKITVSLVTLVERLVSTVSIAVDNHLLYRQLQEVSEQLRIQNQKLREIDKTKDEFISMASHQLRTPLTSVKGYLSMVLEGDVGPVNEKQKDMVKKAFNSAQRMVYLIADMLNVSRLQTGKFVIENKPTYLPEVVEGEVEQLKEQATLKKIGLVYEKPATFPTFNLDETKIRQVVMNFLDNAIYYTAAGGKVTVNLQATSESVTYSITDTGIGVPKTLQHRLFSKFYRADNARKLRPDGTGLGLFMAKKVIVAQGGAIIFSSTEGKGSTFGFSFPRAKMELSPEEAAKTAIKPAEVTLA